MENSITQIPNRIAKRLEAGEVVLAVNKPSAKKLVKIGTLLIGSVAIYGFVILLKNEHVSYTPIYKVPLFYFSMSFLLISWAFARIEIFEIITNRRILFDDSNVGVYYYGTPRGSGVFNQSYPFTEMIGAEINEEKKIRCEFKSRNPLFPVPAVVFLNDIDEPERILKMIEDAKKE